MWTYNNDELYHFGIPGMKWGVRRYQNKDGTLTTEGKKKYDPRYSSEQITRDRRVYGNLGVNRINKRMKNGESISAARSAEASRIDNTRYSARTGRTIGKAVGTVSGLIASKAVMQMLRNTKYSDTVSDPIAQLAISGAVTVVGSQLGQYGGQSIAMLSGGYSPNKFRY